MSGSVIESLDQNSTDRGEKEERIVDIYITAEAVRNIKHKKETEESNTTTTQPSEHSGSECVKIRSYRAATVCLVLLCVLLLTAVIVLCVLIYTNNHQFHNLTEERDQLLTNNTNLTEERDQLLTNNTNLTEERDQLLTRTTNLTEERDQLLTRTTNLTEETNQLLTNNTNLTAERNELIVKYNNISTLWDQLNQEKNELWKNLHDGWIYYNFSLYFISSEKKSWSESRRYCREREADLIIINNKEEQDFVKQKMNDIWIGLSDSDAEGTWKWVDNSTLTTREFWSSREPNGQTRENCVVSYSSGWTDDPCNYSYKWICERKFFNQAVN